jgi:hypothetical protein
LLIVVVSDVARFRQHDLVRSRAHTEATSLKAAMGNSQFSDRSPPLGR